MDLEKEWLVKILSRFNIEPDLELPAKNRTVKTVILMS